MKKFAILLITIFLFTSFTDAKTIKKSYALSDHSGNKVLLKARRDVGVKEGSGRANQIAKNVGLPSSVGRRNAWCAAGVSTWLKESGVDISASSVSQLKQDLRKKGYGKTGIKSGAIVFYTWSHVGIVNHIDSDGYFYAVEANCKNQVRLIKRSVRQVSYFVSID